MDVVVTHDSQRHRFVATVGESESHLFYRRRGEDTVDLLTTYVAPELRGKKVGERLVRAALDWARSEGLSVIPTCWYVDTVVRRYPEYAPLLTR